MRRLIFRSIALLCACGSPPRLVVGLEPFGVADGARTLVLEQVVAGTNTLVVVDATTGAGLEALEPVVERDRRTPVSWTMWRYSERPEVVGGTGLKRPGSESDPTPPAGPLSAYRRDLRSGGLGDWEVIPSGDGPRSPDFPSPSCGKSIGVTAVPVPALVRGAKWVSVLAPMPDGRVVVFTDAIRGGRAIFVLGGTVGAPQLDRQQELEGPLRDGVVTAAVVRPNGELIFSVEPSGTATVARIWRARLGQAPARIAIPLSELDSGALRRVDRLVLQPGAEDTGVLVLTRTRRLSELRPDAPQNGFSSIVAPLVLTDSNCEVYGRDPALVRFRRPCGWLYEVGAGSWLVGWSNAADFTVWNVAERTAADVRSPVEAATGLTPPVLVGGRVYTAAMTRPPAGLFAFDPSVRQFVIVLSPERPRVQEPVLVSALGESLIIFGRDGTLGLWRLDDPRPCPLVRAGLAPMIEPTGAVPWSDGLLVSGYAPSDSPLTHLRVF